MANYSKTYKIRLNSIEKIEELLQETYDYAHKLINEIQIEMNKLSQSTDLSQAMADEKSKYSKSIHDLITDKNKAINMKLDIAKFMGEVLKFKGDVNKAVDESVGINSATSLDLENLRKIIEDSKENDKKEQYELGKKP